MNESRELMKSIQPLRLIINPFFFFTFRVQGNGFSISKSGMIFGLCFLFVTLLYKVSFVFHNPGEVFEEHLDNYGFLAPIGLCAFSFIGYLINAKAIVRTLNQLTVKATFVEDKRFYKDIFRIIVLQVMTCYVVPFVYTTATIYTYSTGGYSETEDDLLDFIGSNCFYYFVMLHFSTTSIIFGNGILFCQRIIQKTNEQLRQMDWTEQKRPDAPSEFFVKQERISKISLMTSRDHLVSTITIYDFVCQWCADFADVFGTPLAACFISSLINMIMYSFYLTKYGIMRLWMFMFIFCFCVIRNWYILYACEKFTREVRNTGIIVNRLIIEGKNQKQKELLQQFSILLLHRKIKFTANGMFVLDYKLIYSTIATVAAYLAIAYQFEYASTTSEGQKGNETGVGCEIH